MPKEKNKLKLCSHCGSVLPSQPAPPDDNVLDLTPRQKQVLTLIAQGMTARDIAAKLRLSHRTAEFHKAMIMERLRLRSTAELTLYAATHKLL